MLKVARNKIGLQFDGWEDYIAKLDDLGNTDLVKKGVKEALVESKKHVNPLIEKAMNKLPAKGKYSTGQTKDSIDKDMTVEWDGLTGSINIGFDFEKSGMTSIFLIYGTPRMKPVTGLKSAIYGNKVKKEVAEIQENTISNLIKKTMEG